MATRYNEMNDEEKKNYIRKNASIFAIVIGVLTLVATALIPVLYEDISFSDILVSFIISCVLGVAFLATGIIFLKKDSNVIAIIMLVLFVLYVADKLYSVIVAFNIIAILWMVLGAFQVFYLSTYLAIKKKGTSAMTISDTAAPTETTPTENPTPEIQ